MPAPRKAGKVSSATERYVEAGGDPQCCADEVIVQRVLNWLPRQLIVQPILVQTRRWVVHEASILQPHLIDQRVRKEHLREDVNNNDTRAVVSIAANTLFLLMLVAPVSFFLLFFLMRVMIMRIIVPRTIARIIALRPGRWELLSVSIEVLAIAMVEMPLVMV